MPIKFEDFQKNNLLNKTDKFDKNTRIDNKNSYYYSYEHRINSSSILLLNTPENFELTIDFYNIKICDKLIGIKLIPNGIHLIKYSLDKNSLSKCFFFESNNLDKRKVIVKKFNNTTYEYEDLDEETTDNYIIGFNKLEFERYLLSYPCVENNNLYENWFKISNHINNKLLSKFDPIIKINDSNFEMYKGFFTDINIVNKKYANKMDKSLILINIINQNEKDKNQFLEIDLNDNCFIKKQLNLFNLLLGEIQMSFILFNICELYDAYIQWKSLLEIVLLSDIFFKNVVTVENKFIIYFFEFLYDMLRFLDKEYFDTEEESIPIIKQLEGFIENLTTNYSDNKIVLKTVKFFRNFFLDHFGIVLKTEEEKISDYVNLLEIKEEDINRKNIENQFIEMDENENNRLKINKSKILKKLLKQNYIDEEDLPVIVDFNNKMYNI